jgi:small GTP-binding protein
VRLGSRILDLSLWDTAGQESYRGLTLQYYRETKISLVVFDLTKKDSLKSIREWNDRLKEVNHGEVIVVLIGNKLDLPNRRISEEQGEQTAAEIGAIYRETSAMTGYGISEVFEDACEEYVKLHRVGPQNQEGSLSEPQSGSPSGCC